EETKIGTLRVGDPVEIDVDAYPGMKFHGKVYQIGSYTASEFSLIPPNNASGNFTKVTQRVPVKISVEQTNQAAGVDPELKPGMSVEVSVKIK
ncbi:MAG TPA: HlyD family secretion protein, partial [Bacteroidota bacterium]|nr:HlyD family secretion protein [Bacteroidota bacterium]